jgi:predicted MFS family arabinose efflux permease
LTGAVAASVAVAFADSSIVVLALPDLYAAFGATIQGIAWVITSYNVAVVVGAAALVPLVRRLDTALLARAGLGVFMAASIACAASDNLTWLIVARSVQGLGAALLLTAALPLLGALTGSHARGAAIWTAAGTFGAALGPALGGALTQAFDWRAIFVAQAPIAGLALVATSGTHLESLPRPVQVRRGLDAAKADLGLAFVFGALVGALFLSVLLVVTVWGLSPIAGAGVVSALPLAAVGIRPLAARLPATEAVGGGGVLLAAGLAAIALLPTTSPLLLAAALGFCGAGIGLAVPTLSAQALAGEAILRSGAVTVGARHAGLVLALAIVAPLLAVSLERGGDRAVLAGTEAILDANVPVRTKVPLAIDLDREIERGQSGEIPDLDGVFDRHGAGSDARLRELQESLVGTLEAVLTRSFRPGFAVAALLALLAAASTLPRLRGRVA